MLITDMTIIERFKNTMRATKATKDIRKLLGLPKIEVLFIERLPPGFNALFVTHCLKLQGKYVMDKNQGKPVIFMDIHYVLPENHDGMVDRLAHELRHYHQFLFNYESFMSNAHEKVVTEEVIGTENTDFYSWREVDARNWSEWYCAGAKGTYGLPVTDSEIYETTNDFNEAGFLAGILARFNSSAPFVFHEFD